MPRSLTDRPIVALGLLAAMLLMWRLGAYGLWESTEARYAEIAAAMVRSGDWLVPRLNGIVHFEKPPLAYWVSAAGMTVFGIDELGARIGLTVAALATLGLTWRWAREAHGPDAAAYAFLCLLSAPLFFALSRSLTTDLYLTLWVTLAYVAGRRAARGGRPAAARIAWLATGLGFLTKGPVVLLWTVLPVLIWSACTGRWRVWRRLADPWGVAIAAIVALPWYAISILHHPDLVEFWLGVQVAERIATPFQGESAPVYAYVPVLLWALGPWIVPAVIEAVRRARGGWRAQPYAIVWILAPVLVFSLLPAKRMNYLLPLVPPLAVYAGAWWARDERGGYGVVRLLGAAWCVLGAGLVVATRVADLPHALHALGWFLGPGFMLGGVAAWYAARRQRRDLGFAAILIPLLSLYVGGYSALSRPDVEAFFKISRPLARAAERALEPGQALVAYHGWPRAFPFYLDRRIVTITADGRETRFEPDQAWREWVITDDDQLARFARGRGALIVLPRGDLQEVEARLGVRLPVLAATRRHLLVQARYDGSGVP